MSRLARNLRAQPLPTESLPLCSHLHTELLHRIPLPRLARMRVSDPDPFLLKAKYSDPNPRRRLAPGITLPYLLVSYLCLQIRMSYTNTSLLDASTSTHASSSAHASPGGGTETCRLCKRKGDHDLRSCEKITRPNLPKLHDKLVYYQAKLSTPQSSHFKRFVSDFVGLVRELDQKERERAAARKAGRKV